MLNNEDLVQLISLLSDRRDAHCWIDEELIDHLDALGYWDATKGKLTDKINGVHISVTMNGSSVFVGNAKTEFAAKKILNTVALKLSKEYGEKLRASIFSLEPKLFKGYGEPIQASVFHFDGSAFMSIDKNAA